MHVIYLAGPYSCPSGYGWNVSRNIEMARCVAISVWELDCAAICPHLNTIYMDGPVSYETFIAGDLAIIERCDAVLMLEGWKQSKGAKREKSHAEKHNIPIFFGLDGLKKWLNKEGA